MATVKGHKALVLEQRNDLVVVVDGCESADSVNECIGIANGFYAVWRQVNGDCFRRAALPPNAQLQKLWLRSLDLGDVLDHQAHHPLTVSPSSSPPIPHS